MPHVPDSARAVNAAGLAPGEHRRPCPACDRGLRDTALAVKVDDDGACWHCHRCGLKGAHNARQHDRPHVAARARPAHDARREAEQRAGKRARCARLWRSCAALGDERSDRAVDYLVARVGAAILPRLEFRVLRGHDALEHFDPETGRRSTWPALVALVQGRDGRIAGVHRTWLGNGDDPAQKAAVSCPKQALGAGESMSGGAIRLMRHDGEIILGEGIESALSAAHLLGAPAWSALNAAMLAAFDPPDNVRSVRIAADLDTNGVGQRAARALAERLRLRGIAVSVEWPATGAGAAAVDWNDIARSAQA